MNFEKFFNPQNIVIIGASATKHKLGNDILLNLKESKRNIFIVNPNHDEIEGIKCYKSILDINENIDLAVIIIKSILVPQALKECGEKGIKNVIIISAGFKEIGNEGILLENQIIEIAKKYNIKVLGPNCLGMIDTYNNINASFAPYMPSKGNIGFLSQSGAICTAMLDIASLHNIGFSKFISLGNKAVLNESDFLEIFSNDPNTKIIIMYLETISDGQRFIKTIKNIKKPIVVLKTGKSEKASNAMMSHTGSIAGDYKVFEAICKQYNLINISSISEMFDISMLASSNILKPLKNLIILTNAGGPAVIATDMISTSKNLSLIEIPQNIKENLKKLLPHEAALNNPIDIIGDATSERYEIVLKNIVNIKNLDAILLIVTPQSMTDSLNIAKIIEKYNPQKPIIPIFIGGKRLLEAKNYLKQKNIVVFDFLKNAISALDNIAQQKTSSIKNEEKINTSKKTKNENIQEINLLSTKDSIQLLKKYNINHVKTYIINKKEELNKINIEFPVVVKADGILHKSDVNAVHLNIKNKSEILNAWKVINNYKKSILIQPMLQKMTELIIGVKKDPVFGHIIMFGIGGIFVEVYKDVSIKSIPLSTKDIDDMINSIKGKQIIYGARGKKPLNIDAIKQIIQNLSKLVIENPNISEIDLNPVMVDDKKAIVVDAKIILDKTP